MLLNGKNLIVLGATGHIGTRLCKGLVDLGANVVGVSRNSKQLDQSMNEFSNHTRTNINFISVKADMHSDKDLERVINFTENNFGLIHGWVNSANESVSTINMEYTRNEIRKEFENLISFMMATKYIAKYFQTKSIAGSIVNISSIYALGSPIPEIYQDTNQIQNPVSYGTAKAGLLQFSRFAAVNLAPLGIRVNSVVLGPFPSSKVQADENFLKNLLSHLPLRRVGQPEEVVGAVGYLLSDQSTFTTGAQIVIDGGWTAI
jgi:NAD(P)-dependent dehydrogenase (short-subunit alcohol dehydrogenase family)